MEKLAFDLKKYQNVPNAEKRIAGDLTSLSIETESGENSGVVAFKYVVNLEDKRVICPDYDPDTDVRELFGKSPDIEAICNQALDPETDWKTWAYLWISPPEGYPQSRLGIGVGRRISEKVVEITNYSGLDYNLNSEECLQLANWAGQFALGKEQVFTQARGLDETPIFMDSGESEALEFVLKVIMKRPDIWARIESGEIKEIMKKRKEIADEIAKDLAPAILGLSHNRDFIRVGAVAERKMMDAAGIVMEGKGSGCGALNIEVSTGDIFAVGYEISIGKEKGYCPEIVCPSCGWKPRGSQLQELSEGRLLVCPDCSYNPATRKHEKPITQPQSQEPKVEISIPQEKSLMVVEQPKPKAVNNEIPWLVFLFAPWQDPNWVRRHASSTWESAEVLVK